jgi:hypothetical protein
MINNTSKQLIRFFWGFLLVASLIFFCDQGIGKILRIFYFHQKAGLYHRTTYAIDSTFADIVVLGSSRAHYGYVSEIFEDKLNLNCYNAGIDQSFLLSNYAIFKAITYRYNPKLIIIDIAPSELTEYASEYERLSFLLPYCQTHQEIKQVVSLRSPIENLKQISAIYPFNSMILHIASVNLKHYKEKLPDIKGYVPLFHKMKNEKIDTIKYSDFIISENKIAALKDIISSCQKNNIDIVFVRSPIWGIYHDKLCDVEIFKLFSENRVRYFDMLNQPTFINNPDFFADQYHLNDEGARVFSNMLIDKILHAN